MSFYQCVRLVANFCLPVCRTFKQDCPVHILVKVDSSGKELEVKIVLLEHNHSVSHFIAVGRKRQRCGICTGCSSSDCGHCKYCIDKPKFGEPGKKRQGCEKRRCLNSDGGISHSIEKVADSKAFTISTVS